MKYGPKQAVYPFDPKVIGRSHSWCTYNLTGHPKLVLNEKKGLCYGAFENGLWSYDGEFYSPEDINSGSKKWEWGNNPNYSDFHGALDIVPKKPIDRPLKVKNILKGKVVKVLKRGRGQSSVWIESEWRGAKIIWVYQHLYNKYLAMKGKEIHTGDVVGHVGYLISKGVDYSHLHLECISKKKFNVPENMRLTCSSKTDLRSQFNYDRLESIKITGKHYMYNGIFFIDFINS